MGRYLSCGYGGLRGGVKDFVEHAGKSLDDTYTAEEIARLVKGQYGAEQFVKAIEKE